ncbi:hypothetical protein ABI59_03660 [Acidobacteria bacterium Mor1]|nr:hypothetical protein ABI59_03660 [Acidobacteria bacterium Mor1]
MALDGRWPMKARLLLAGLILLAAAAGYAATLDHGFIQDDHPVLRLNPIVERGDLVEIWGTDYWAGVGGGDTRLYRPLTLTSFAWQVDGDGELNTRSAHGANLLIHGLCAVLLAFYAMRLGSGVAGAGAAGLLFALHPIHVAAVAPLTGRSELLALLFGLAAMLAVDRAREAQGKGVHRLAWLGALALFLALAAKEIAIVVPGLALVQLWPRRPNKQPLGWLAARIGPLVAAAAAHLLVRFQVIGSIGGQSPPLSDNFLAGMTWFESLPTRLALASHALERLIWPASLSADYSGNVIPAESSLFALRPLIGLLILLLAATAVVAALRRAADSDRRRLGLAAGWFLLPWLLAGNLLLLIGVIFAERLLYFPSAGFCLLLGVGIDLLQRRLPLPSSAARQAAVWALIAALSVAALTRTRSEVPYWQDEEALFQRATITTPDSPRAHFTLAKIRLRNQQDEQARQGFQRAVDLWPQFSSAWYEIGLIHARRNEMDPAIENFRRALEVRPEHSKARLGLGQALHRKGRLEEAEQQLVETLKRNPAEIGAAAELGHVLLDAGRYEDAANIYRQAIANGREDLRPALDEALRRLGR